MRPDMLSKELVTIGQVMNKKGSINKAERESVLQSLKNIEAITSLYLDGYNRFNLVRETLISGLALPDGISLFCKDPDESAIQAMNDRLNTVPDPKKVRRVTEIKRSQKSFLDPHDPRPARDLQVRPTRKLTVSKDGKIRIESIQKGKKV